METGITVVCVLNGYKYGIEDVRRLKEGVARHLPMMHNFVWITDFVDRKQNISFPGTHKVPLIENDFEGWWAKMKVFDYARLSEHRVIYFDLDMLICGDLTPLAEWDGEFGICGNFTRAAGHKSWPCRYGSCCMSLAPGFGEHIWRAYNARRRYWESAAGNYGDQWVIEQIDPSAKFLQDELPEGFFASYRDLVHMPEKPEGLSVGVYAGGRTPERIGPPWAIEEWQL